MRVAELIEQKLRDALSPQEIEVIDQSYLHVGHAGAREGGESHFRIRVVSAAFDGKTRVARQRMINQILADELKEQIHALSMDLSAP